ncbi:flagellar hook protein FlgE [Frateuria defendens]|uniref:flagellar hook protein FlgE n=1 Tax=Frateuria defendens TaxID=2219559 RepID=UPI00066FFE77|nr:flagellar hook protein FlgE [Frateuria defendens]
MALNQALSGINAAQSDLNVISNNIANANTTGFKGSRAEFADVYATTGLNLNATTVGSGARLADVAQQFNQGDIETTGNSLDLAISGNGFFTVNTGSGYAYTRAGAFHQNPDGEVVNSEGYHLQVYPYNAGTDSFDTSALNNLNLVTAQSTATATGTATIASNLPASAGVPATVPFSTSDSTSYTNTNTFTVYDSLGTSHQASVYYVKTGVNSWDAHLYVDGNNAGTSQLTFGPNGTLAGSTSASGAAGVNGKVSFNAVNYGNGATTQALTLDFGKTTQFGTDYSGGTVNQDGYPAGVLSSIDINGAGVVVANYSNGQSSKIGQLAVANFANMQGLRQLGNTAWAASTDSGVPVMGTASSGQFGTIQSGALEESNTADTTAQLVDMIKAQRNYQASAQVLGTDNTLTSALFNAVSR